MDFAAPVAPSSSRLCLYAPPGAAPLPCRPGRGGRGRTLVGLARFRLCSRHFRLAGLDILPSSSCVASIQKQQEYQHQPVISSLLHDLSRSASGHPKGEPNASAQGGRATQCPDQVGKQPIHCRKQFAWQGDPAPPCPKGEPNEMHHSISLCSIRRTPCSRRPHHPSPSQLPRRGPQAPERSPSPRPGLRPMPRRGPPWSR
jgi:hypothetical protein